jgi:hypothetical protein
MPFIGVVKQVLADDEVVIESYGISLQGLIGFGKESVVELMVYPIRILVYSVNKSRGSQGESGSSSGW